MTETAPWDALLDGERWDGWLAGVVGALGGIGGTFALVDAAERRVSRLIGSWLDAPGGEDYARYWHRFDPQVAQVCAIDATATYLDTEHVDRGDPMTRAFMDWSRGEVGFDHHLGAVIPVGSGQYRAALSVHRGTGDGQVPATMRARLDALLPDLERAVRLGFAEAEVLTDAFWRGVLAGADARALLLLDERGQVLRRSGGAEALLRRGEGIGIAQRRLRVADPGIQSALDRVVAAAVAREAAAAGSLAIPRGEGRRPLLLTLTPFAWQRRMLAPVEAAALVRIEDAGVPALPPRARLAAAFALSAREAEVAEALLRGHSVESAAAVLTISVATARTHVRRLLAKTGTSRQAELVLLLARLSG